jgi:hypothetical protein
MDSQSEFSNIRVKFPVFVNEGEKQPWKKWGQIEIWKY